MKNVRAEGMAENLEAYRPEMTRDRRKKPRVQTRGFWLVEPKPLCPTRRGLDDAWSTSARGLNPVLPLHHIRSHAIAHGPVQHHGPVEGRRGGCCLDWESNSRFMLAVYAP